MKQTMRGFTLVEVLIALFVVSLGVGGAVALVSQTISFASNASSRLTGTFLAQEGVEIARNIRDSNFLNIHNGGSGSWDAGLTRCATGCEADYSSSVLGVDDRFLNFVTVAGFYGYGSGTATQFKRKIFVDSGVTDIRNVTVNVTWQDRDKTYTVSGATVLYNWLTPIP